MQQNSTWQRLLEKVALFLDWWGYELKLLIPQSLKVRFEHQKKWIAFLIQQDKISVFDHKHSNATLTPTHFDTTAEGLKSLDKFITGLKKKHNSINFGIVLSQDECFQRSLDFPKQSKAKLKDIISLDLERSTPFKRKNIYHDYFIEDSNDTTLNVKHIIVKKTIVNEKRDFTTKHQLPLQFIDVINKDQTSNLKINLLRHEAANQAHQTKHFFHYLILSIIILFLSIGALLQLSHNQDKALAQLDRKLKTEKRKALKIRKKISELQSTKSSSQFLVKKKSSSIETLEIWRELTQKLPDTVWIENFKINPKTVQITGYTDSSEKLIQILEKSVLFSNVRFYSPVSMDSQRQRERFSISMSLEEKEQINFAQGENK